MNIPDYFRRVEIAQLLSGIQQGDRRLIAKAITLVENDQPGYEELFSRLTYERKTPVIGITGPPGAGKSTLINALIHELTRKTNGEGLPNQVAVIAVDPSSPFTHGSLLGDRLRMQEHFNNPHVFIRSLATRGALGGLSAKTIEICDVLRSAPFDYIFIETVGVGQSEVEIISLADTVVVTLVPEAGDEIQALKSGIMEIPDVFAVNKSDLGGAAQKTAAEIGRSGSRPDRQEGWHYPVCLVSATHHTGIPALIDHLAQHRHFLDSAGLLEQLRFKHQSGWVMRLLKEEFGSFGMQLAGGRSSINERLNSHRLNPFGEYEKTRHQILSRFSPADSSELFIKKEETL